MNYMIKSRINMIRIVVVFSFLLIILRLFSMIIYQGDYYYNKLLYMTNKSIFGEEAPRGKIYDSNMNVLVDNKLVEVIYYKNSFNLGDKEELDIAYVLANKLDVSFNKVTSNMLKKTWLIKNDGDKLISNKEWKDFRNRKLNSTDIYNLKLERIPNNEIDSLTNLDKEASYIYYLMHNGYSYQDKVIKKGNISDSELAYICEHIDVLKGVNIKYNWERTYPYNDVFKTILGNVGSIPYEEKEYYLNKGYSLSDSVGISFIEKQYEDILKGTKPIYKMLSSDKVVLVKPGKKGNDIVLSIDINLQKEIENILSQEVIKIKNEPATEFYNHSYVVLAKPNSGEILSMASKQVISINNKYQVVDYSHNISTSAMTPGSVVKGASLIVGYNNNAIKIGEYIYDDCIKIYNKPKKCSFTKLGRINDIEALVWSSNVYQFKTAMKVSGYDYVYNGKFNVTEEAINKYRNIFNQFGLGVKTGIDLPKEGIGNVGTNKSSDLYLNYAIGIYDTYTPLQLVQYINTFASNGKRYQLRLLKGYFLDDDYIEMNPVILNEVDTEYKYLERVQLALEEGAKRGIAAGHMAKNILYAGKTGTSESFLDTNHDGIVDTMTNSSAFVGYAPSKNPIMSMIVISPNLVNPNSNSNTRSFANSRISRLVSNAFFKIYDKK